MREAFERRDKKILGELAASEEVRDSAPSTLLVLAGALSEGKFRGEQVEGLLRKAQQRHPDDFWANHQLGICLVGLRSPRREEAIRFQTAAVALRPQSAAAHVSLGRALAAKGQQDLAIEEYHEALRLNKNFPAAHITLGDALREQGAAG